MEQKVLILSSLLKERIWGGSFFKDVLKKTNSDEKIGEMWSCSAIKDSESIIINGDLKGEKLSDCFKNHKELFNNSTLNEFPILIKLIATSDVLSVQVHPDDTYAKEHENSMGKTEGWLILKTKENSNIIISHNAKNKEELINYINNDDYEHLLKKVNVHEGEFYPIPSKTIHALGKDLLLLEIQQSSDITYRFYDYHRKDKNGNERPLHIKQAIECTSFTPYNYKIKNVLKEDSCIVWENQYFLVSEQKINDSFIINNTNHDYLIVSVVKGSIKVNEYTLNLGDCFIITSLCEKQEILGNGIIVITKSLI